MSNFLERLHQASAQKAPKNMILGLFFLSSGALLGYIKANYQASLSDNYIEAAHLKQYISQDQVNAQIDRTSKPAVLYYYQPGSFYHYVIRNGFLKCSSRYHNQADFYMVNLTKKLLQAEDQIQHKFPFDDYMMEIRFPKDSCEVKLTNGQVEEKQTYRRQFFCHEYRKEGGVQCFIQQNGIKPAFDPLQQIFRINSRCLFDDGPFEDQQI